MRFRLSADGATWIASILAASTVVYVLGGMWGAFFLTTLTPDADWCRQSVTWTMEDDQPAFHCVEFKSALETN